TRFRSRGRARAGPADQAVQAAGQGQPDPVQPVARCTLRVLDARADPALLRDRVRSGHFRPGANPAWARHRRGLRPAQDCRREKEPRRARPARGRKAGRARVSFTWWTYRRRFTAGRHSVTVVTRARSDELVSELAIDGVPFAWDRTPAFGPEAVRNHRLAASLPDGSQLEVEAGYVSSWSIGIAARLDGELIHESHPGRTIAYPDKYRETVSAIEATTL